MSNFFYSSNFIKLFHESCVCFKNIMVFDLDKENREDKNLLENINKVSLIVKSCLTLLDRDFSVQEKEDITSFLHGFLERYQNALAKPEVETYEYESLKPKHYCFILCDFLHLTLVKKSGLLSKDWSFVYEETDPIFKDAVQFYYKDRRLREYADCDMLDESNVDKTARICKFIEQIMKEGISDNAIFEASEILLHELYHVQYIEEDLYEDLLCDSDFGDETGETDNISLPLLFEILVIIRNILNENGKIRDFQFLCQSLKYIYKDHNCKRMAGLLTFK